MIAATAWNNAQHHQSGAGYGLKISPSDRDQYFRREWRRVQLRIGTDATILVNIDKDSFWNDTCRELISADLGRWMLANRFAPWPRGRPPRFTLVPREPGLFDVTPSPIAINIIEVPPRGMDLYDALLDNAKKLGPDEVKLVEVVGRERTVLLLTDAIKRQATSSFVTDSHGINKSPAISSISLKQS